MEKLQTPPILETELGAKRLALANQHNKEDLSDPQIAERCVRETLDTLDPCSSKTVVQILGKKTVKFVKDIAA